MQFPSQPLWSRRNVLRDKPKGNLCNRTVKINAFPFLILEPGLIEVSLVLKYSPDVDEGGVLHLGSHTANTTDEDTQGIKQIKSSKDSLVDGVINLCSPVQVCIMPKATR